MFKLFDEEEKFNWKSIVNVGEGRAHLGEEMPVFLYRLFQFTIKDEITKQLGNEKCIEIFRNAGKLAGLEFANNMLNLDLELEAFMADLQEILQDHKVGILRVEEFNQDTGKAMLTIGEDLDCSGLPVVGETVCNYDEGFLGGILEAYTQKEYVVTEIDCWATGSRVCRFEAHLKNR